MAKVPFITDLFPAVSDISRHEEYNSTSKLSFADTPAGLVTLHEEDTTWSAEVRMTVLQEVNIKEDVIIHNINRIRFINFSQIKPYKGIAERYK